MVYVRDMRRVEVTIVKMAVEVVGCTGITILLRSPAVRRDARQ